MELSKQIETLAAKVDLVLAHIARMEAPEATMTKAQVKDYLKIKSDTTIAKYEDRGLLKRINRSGRPRFRRSEVESLKTNQ